MKEPEPKQLQPEQPKQGRISTRRTTHSSLLRRQFNSFLMDVNDAAEAGAMELSH